MITGLRAADAPVFQRHCAGDLKVLLRLGSLLQQQLTFTEAALQTLAEAGTLAKVMDPRVRAVQVAGFAVLAAELGWDAAGLLLVEQDGWRIVALEDEVGNPFAAAAQPANVLIAPTLVESLDPALRPPVEGLLAARADDQRAAALEQLRYAMPPLAVVGELMPLLLADGAEIVRERAIGLLGAAGAATLVVDLIRAIQRQDAAGVLRTAEPVSRLPGVQQDLAVAALLATLGRGDVAPHLVELAERLAGHLAHHRSLERLIDLLLPSGLSLLGFVRAVQAVDRARCDQALLLGMGQGAAADARLICLLAAPGPSPVADADALLARGLDLLLAPEQQPSDRLSLAGALLRLDHDGVLATGLAQRAAAVPASWDTAVYWLLAELCRAGAVGPEAAAVLAGACRTWLREARGPHLISLLEQQVPALLPAPEALRSRLVEPLIEVVARYRDERTRDVIVACLTRLGAAAVAPLWEVLDGHPQVEVRILAGELLPSLLGPADLAERAAALARLLAGLPRIDQAVERVARVSAAALLVDEPAAAAAVLAACSGLGDRAMDALGYLAATPHLLPERRAAIVDTLLIAVQEEVPDHSGAVVGPAGADGEQSWLLDDALARHTDSVPRALIALGRIGAAPSCPPELLARITARLCRQWKLVAGWRVVWGPGAAQELVRTLVRIAEPAAYPGPLRIQVCEALAPQASLLSVVRGLARVLMHGEGPFLARLGGQVAARLIELASTAHWADDEQEEVVEALTDLLAVPQLGADADTLRRRLAQLIAMRKDHATSRARARLRFLRGDLPPHLSDLLEWA